jgi:hypothetical protein
MSKIDRIGEKGINNFGSEMIITEYRKWNDIDAYFPQYDWVARNRAYCDFKKGNIKCPYEKRVFGVGYIGEGKYKVWENGKDTRVYNTWHSMLERCYSEKYKEKHPTYISCKVCEEWHNFQHFAEWFEENYYEVEGQRMHLDKDILVKHNKIYSPKTCIFAPDRINKLFVKRDNDRGDSVIGTTPTKNGKYVGQCSLLNPETGKSKQEYLGLYETQEKAFEVYKYYKERNIKQIADYYKNQIPERLYNGLYNYEVEITD